MGDKMRVDVGACACGRVRARASGRVRAGTCELAGACGHVRVGECVRARASGRVRAGTCELAGACGHVRVGGA
jgi:hypothetical protein